MTEKERLDKISLLKSEMRSMLTKAESEKRNLTEDEQSTFDSLSEEIARACEQRNLARPPYDTSRKEKSQKIRWQTLGVRSLDLRCNLACHSFRNKAATD